MKLAAKFVSIIVLGIIIILVVDAYISLQRQTEFFEKDMKLDADRVGAVMKSVVEDAWRMGGQKRALRAIEEASRDGYMVTIRWVWLDAPAEDLHGPKVSSEKLKPVIHGETMSFKEKDKDGKRYFRSYIPVAVDENRPGALELSESLAQLDERTRTALIRVFVLTGVLVLLSAFAVLLLGVKMVGRPLNRIIEKIRRIGTGDFSGPLQLPRHDELGELAVWLNTVCEQLEDAKENIRVETEGRIVALEQLRHEDRLKTVGRLAAGVAHELGTPLNVISGRAGMIARGNLSSAETMENANTIKGQSNRITTIIRQLLDFARRRSTQKTLVDLRQMVRRTVDLIAPLGRKQKVELSFSVDDDTLVKAEVDAEQIEQVLINILTNSLQAMPQGGRVEVGIGREHARPPEGHDGAEGDYLCICVRDEGQGISEEDMGHIFEPFFTTKDTGQGTGLGLSIAHGIVREHGGWIGVESEVGKGSCFSIYLPQEDELCQEES